LPALPSRQLQSLAVKLFELAFPVFGRLCLTLLPKFPLCRPRRCGQTQLVPVVTSTNETTGDTPHQVERSGERLKADATHESPPRTYRVPPSPYGTFDRTPSDASSPKSNDNAPDATQEPEHPAASRLSDEDAIWKAPLSAEKPIAMEKPGGGRLPPWRRFIDDQHSKWQRRGTGQKIHSLLAAAALIGLACDVVGYITLESRICKGKPDITASQNAICEQSETLGYMMCHARPTQCEGRNARFVTGNVHLDDIVVPDLTKISILGYVRLLLTFGWASIFNFCNFIAYVVWQPLIQNPPILFLIWHSRTILKWTGRIASGKAAENMSPLEMLQKQRAATNAGPASRQKIQEALSGIADRINQRFRD